MKNVITPAARRPLPGWRPSWTGLLAVAALALAAVLSPVPAQAQAQAQPSTPVQGAAAPLTAPTPAATALVQAPENPYGLQALWAQGDLVAKGTLVLMLLMSLGSWYLIVTRLLAQ